jgi:hypothetical protein
MGIEAGGTFHVQKEEPEEFLPKTASKKEEITPQSMVSQVKRASPHVIAAHRKPKAEQELPETTPAKATQSVRKNLDEKAQAKIIVVLEQHLAIAKQNIKKKFPTEKATTLTTDLDTRMKELKQNKGLFNWTEEAKELLTRLDSYSEVDSAILENSLKAICNEKLAKMLAKEYKTIDTLCKKIDDESIFNLLQRSFNEKESLSIFKMLQSEAAHLKEIGNLSKKAQVQKISVLAKEAIVADHTALKTQSQVQALIETIGDLLEEEKMKVKTNPSAAVPRIYTDETKGYGIHKDADEADPASVPLSIRAARTSELWLKGAVGLTRPTNFLAGESPYSKACSEVSSRNFADGFGFNNDKDHPLVPLTALVHEPGKTDGPKGTFQEFVQGYELAEKVDIDLNTLSKEEKLLFLKFIMFDFLIGNLDRHDKNWMIKIENGKLVGIAAIDNGNAFPVKLPVDRFADSRVRKRQYEWRSHILANMKIDDETMNELRAFARDNKITDEAKLQSFVSQERDLFLASRDVDISNHANVFCCQEMRDMLALRAKGLQAWLDSETPTVGSLAALQSAQEIYTFLDNTVAR